MCKSLAEGGQRCAAHAKARLERRAVAMREAAVRAADGSPANIEAFHKRRADWEQAAVEYASTPAGQEVLSARQVQAFADRDEHTAAMLTTILTRGQAMREANAQIRAALALGAFTETELPAPPPPEYRTVAEDETGNPLNAEDQEAWLGLLDAVHADMDDGKVPGPAGEKAVRILREADQAIASAASTEEQVSLAVLRLVSPYRSGADRLDSSLEQTLSRFWPVTREQVRRALNHPNAGYRVFAWGAGALPIDEVLQHPRCPGNLALFLNPSAHDFSKFEDRTWSVLRDRAQTSPASAAFVAAHDPTEAGREDARIALAGARWDTLDQYELRAIRDGLPAAMGGAEQAAAVEASLVEWVRFFGDAETQKMVLTDQERAALASAAPAASARTGEAPVEAGAAAGGVSLLRRSPKRSRQQHPAHS